MALFGKKKKEEEEEKEEKEKKSPKKRSSKKKKSELPQPWTKKERTLVLYVFLVMVLVSAVLAASARSWKLPNLPRITLPKFNFFQGEIVTLVGNDGSADDFARVDTITNNFKAETRRLSGVYTLFVNELSGGFSFGVLQDEPMQAASLMKLPVMVTLYMEAEAGTISLDDIYTLSEEDKVTGSGSLYSQPAGKEFTYKELVEAMGQQSDNTAFRAVLRILGERKVKENIRQVGMVNTDFDENETTAKDIGLFFTKLWKGELVTEANRDELLSFLTDTIYEEHLAAGVPEGVPVAHKYGREVHVVNDAGIVYTDKPFVVVIMSKGVVEDEADKVFPELSRIVFERESN